MHRLSKSLACIASLALCIYASSAAAETKEVRFAQQFSMTYLQLNVMNHQKLIEKHAAALGMPDVKTSWVKLSGGNTVNDALLSGAVDFASGGVPGLITIWDKTFETPQEVRGVSALGHFELLLNTRNPNIKSIRDFDEDDKIGIVAVKVSGQALILQMAAAREWGQDQYDRLDSLTVAVNPADQTTGLLSGSSDFESVFSSPPFQTIQTADPRIHTVLSSVDVVGDATSAVLYTTKAFHDENPTVYKAVIAALEEATEFVNKNPRQAVEYYVEDTGGKGDVEELTRLLSLPHYGFSLTPNGFETYADFMQKIGRIDRTPESWKDMFFPEVHHLPGS